jgi:hypothetical protein
MRMSPCTQGTHASIPASEALVPFFISPPSSIAARVEFKRCVGVRVRVQVKKLSGDRAEDVRTQLYLRNVSSSGMLIPQVRVCVWKKGGWGGGGAPMAHAGRRGQDAPSCPPSSHASSDGLPDARPPMRLHVPAWLAGWLHAGR